MVPCLLRIVYSASHRTSALAGILGDTVQIDYLFPDMNTPYGLSTTGVITASGGILHSLARVDIGYPRIGHDSVMTASSSVPEPSTAILLLAGIRVYMAAAKLRPRVRGQVTHV